MHDAVILALLALTWLSALRPWRAATRNVGARAGPRIVCRRRMRAAIGRSPKSEIIRARLQLVQDYLIETDLPLSDIAERVNFQHPQYMSELFKKKIGQTPGAYRQSFRRPVD